MISVGQFKGKAIKVAANTGWKLFQSVNRILPEGKAVHPNWAPHPILKSYQREYPELGFPRETDSLCPKCILEAKNDVLNGKKRAKFPYRT